MFADIESEPPDGQNLARCDHYQGCGICSFGCWEEPRCITEQPREGWPDPHFTAQEANSIVVRRYAHRMQNWIAWQRIARFSATGRLDTEGCDVETR